MRTKILGWALVAVLGGVGCGGGTTESTEAESQSGETEGAEHHDGDEHGELPPSVEEFHSALAPVWHSEAGARRAALACENADTFSARADVITTSAMPEGVDPAAWQSATGALTSTVQDLRADCESGGGDAEAKLSAVHDAFHAVVEQLRADR